MPPKTSSAFSVFKTIVVDPPAIAATGQSKGTIIFFHGSGDCGRGVKTWIEVLLDRNLVSGGLRVLYPSAPMRPYTPNFGRPQAVWFDRKRIAFDAEEDVTSIDYMCDQVGQMIEEEKLAGVSENNIVLGGFSMGGAMAMYLAYRRFPNVRAVFALSSFLNENSCVYESLHQSNAVKQKLPRLFQAHGSDDELVPDAWGAATSNSLKGCGVNVQFHLLDKTSHEMNTEELVMLEEFIHTCFSTPKLKS